MTVKRLSPKQQREQKILLGLVELYIKSGQAIASNTLKEHGFESISSATIRNYFAKLENEGYLEQQHSSGGRVPTDLAYKLYAHNHIEEESIDAQDDLFLHTILSKETKELASYFQQGLEALSEVTGCASFIAPPKFDKDVIEDIKLMKIDPKRCLCVIMTGYGMVHTEVLFTPLKLGSSALKKIEEYFKFRINGKLQPKLSDEELSFASLSYNEIILRHIVSHSQGGHRDLYKSGFSKLLQYSDFQDSQSLSSSLSLFEDPSHLASMMGESLQTKQLKFWIGKDLAPYTKEPYLSSVIVVPYTINHQAVGTIALLGPRRVEYPKLFGQLKTFSKYLSESLTNSIYKYKISYRENQINEIDTQSIKMISY